MATHIEPVPDQLTLHEQFRLIEIAHETGDSQVKAQAMALLTRHLMPVTVTVRAEDLVEARIRSLK